MSSIDKYVAGEARKYNPDVVVEHINGRLVGKINGREIFSIADRYGYLNKEEESIIKSSMLRFEEEEKERIRIEKEQCRLALNKLHREIETAKEDLTSTASIALNSIMSMRQELEEDGFINSEYSIDISIYRNKINQIFSYLEKAEANIHSKKKQIFSRFDKMIQSASEDKTSEELFEMIRTLSSIDRSIDLVVLPTDELKSIKYDLEHIANIDFVIKDVCVQFQEISSKSKLKQRANFILEYIRTYKVASLQDAQALMNRIQNEIINIQNEIYIEEHSKEYAELRKMKAMSEAIAQVNVSSSSIVSSANYRKEIVECANNIHKAYNDLLKADYTTCTDIEISRVINLVQEIINGDSCDKITLDNLNIIYKKAEEYASQDFLLKCEYKAYKALLDDLITRGVDVTGELRFDTVNSREQRNRLYQMRLNKDNQDIESQTTSSFIVACETMEEMGYRMLAYDMRNTLAQEAIYLNPRYPGVAVQVIASGNNVIRRTIALNVDGKQTSVDHVLNMTKQMDADNDPYLFLGKYWEKGERFELSVAIDETLGDVCRDTVIKHGSFTIEKDGLSKYLEIMNLSTFESNNIMTDTVVEQKAAIQISSYNAINEEAHKRKQEIEEEYLSYVSEIENEIEQEREFE